MAARKRKVELDEQWRGRIRVTMLIERLMKHSLGDVEMTPTQIRAAEILLRKVVPDLSSTEHKGEVTNWVIQVPGVSPSTEQWEQETRPAIQ